MTRRLLITLLLVAGGAVVGGATVTAQAEGGIDVIEVSGPLDGLAVRYVTGEIESAAQRGADAAILQLDSPGSVSDEFEDLLELVANPPLPLIVWVGEAPAVAYGQVAELVAAAPVSTAAPGVRVGFVDGDDVVQTIEAGADTVDEVQPAIGQIVVWLDGRAIDVEGGQVVLSTAESVVEDGESRLRPTVDVRFQEQPVLARIVRSALRPEVALFYLLAGLSLVAFEFYALGPGLAAATASLPLLLGGYGLVALPIRWWALGLVLLGWWSLTVDFQWGSFGRLSALGLVSAYLGGLFLTDTGPAFPPTWWGVLLVIVVIAAFYFTAMPTVARSRFSTATIGRDHLIGRQGLALTGFDPDGLVEVDGARWRATAHREEGIETGATVNITGLEGAYLEVELVDRGERETNPG